MNRQQPSVKLEELTIVKVSNTIARQPRSSTIDDASLELFRSGNMPLVILRPHPGKDFATANEELTCHGQLMPLAIPSHCKRVLKVGNSTEATEYFSEEYMISPKEGTMGGMVMLLRNPERGPLSDAKRDDVTHQDSCETEGPVPPWRIGVKFIDQIIDFIRKQKEVSLRGTDRACLQPVDSWARALVVEWDWYASTAERPELQRLLRRKYFGNKHSPVIMVAMAAPDRTFFWLPVLNRKRFLADVVDDLTAGRLRTAYNMRFIDGPNIFIAKIDPLPWIRQLPHPTTIPAQ